MGARERPVLRCTAHNGIKRACIAPRSMGVRTFSQLSGGAPSSLTRKRSLVQTQYRPPARSTFWDECEPSSLTRANCSAGSGAARLHEMSGANRARCRPALIRGLTHGMPGSTGTAAGSWFSVVSFTCSNGNACEHGDARLGPDVRGAICDDEGHANNAKEPCRLDGQRGYARTPSRSSSGAVRPNDSRSVGSGQVRSLPAGAFETLAWRGCRSSRAVVELRTRSVQTSLRPEVRGVWHT
jgi:hypothetical protein